MVEESATPVATHYKGHELLQYGWIQDDEYVRIETTAAEPVSGLVAILALEKYGSVEEMFRQYFVKLFRERSRAARGYTECWHEDKWLDAYDYKVTLFLTGTLRLRLTPEGKLPAIDEEEDRDG